MIERYQLTRPLEYRTADNGERFIAGFCSTEEVDTQGTRVIIPDEVFEDYIAWSNVRYMHAYNPVGRVVEWDRRSVGDVPGWYIKVLIADDDVWKKIEAGVLTAFSVGFLVDQEASHVPSDGEDGETVLVAAKLIEISIVDRPANESCKFVITKREDEDDYVTRPYLEEHSCRLRDPGEFEKGSFRRFKNGRLIFIWGRLKGGSRAIQAYRYRTDEWNEDEARSHCQSHGGRFEPAKEGWMLSAVKSVVDRCKKLVRGGDDMEEMMRQLEELRTLLAEAEERIKRLEEEKSEVEKQLAEKKAAEEAAVEAACHNDVEALVSEKKITPDEVGTWLAIRRQGKEVFDRAAQRLTTPGVQEGVVVNEGRPGEGDEMPPGAKKIYDSIMKR